MRTVAVVPAKRFGRAKSRLATALPGRARSQLAEAMLTDVLGALAGVAAIEQTIVVTRGRRAAQAARRADALVIRDEHESGATAAARLGIWAAAGAGFERVLCVAGDCPTLDAAEVTALLDRQLRDRVPVVIVPDRHGSGTNGLLLTPPGAIAPAFGPDSARRHRWAAEHAGLPHRVEHLPSLMLDVDTGPDLATLRERLTGHGARAASTRSFLAEVGASLQG